MATNGAIDIRKSPLAIKELEFFILFLKIVDSSILLCDDVFAFYVFSFTFILLFGLEFRSQSVAWNQFSWSQIRHYYIDRI